MEVSLFIALINPGMSLVLATALFLLWYHQRQHRYLLVLTIALVTLASGFLLQYFPIFGFTASRFLSNLAFVGGVASIVLGSLGRYDRKPPVRIMAGVSAVGFAAYSWFLLVDSDLTWRIYAINFTVGTMCLLLAAEIRAVNDRKPIDNLLLGIIAFFGFMFFVRPVLVIWIDGPYTNVESLHQTLYWITLTFTAPLFLVLYILITITAVSLDAMDELRRESQTDPLSGLLNRRGFEEGAAKVLKAAQRKGLPAALIVCDLDHFKMVNDNHGHACGDQVIATFAGSIGAGAGPSQLVGRLGGEEFAVLLPDATLASGRLFAEGVRVAFAATPVAGLPDGMRFTASFGVAELGRGESMTSLFARADRALYAAKKAGRDRVRMATIHDAAQAPNRPLSRRGMLTNQ